MLYQTENQHGGDVYGGGITLDFSANTNPLGTPPSVLEAVCRALPQLHRYPDPYCRRLVQAIAGHEQVPASYILCGNGAADLIYCDEGSLIGIEVKCPGTRHKVAHLIEQAEWLIRVPKWGYFCDDLDDFLNIIDGGVGGIDPVKVLEYCKKTKTQHILWDKSLFI